MNALRRSVAVASLALLAACGPPMASAAPLPETGPRTMQTRPNDLIVWQHVPGFPDYSIKITDVDVLKCKPALEDWKEYQPSGPGYCSKIALASDNPGYPVEGRCAPPLKNVIDQVGDGC